MSYKNLLRRTIPLIVTLIVGVIVIWDFYFQGTPVVSDTVPMLTKWANIIWGFAMPYAVLAMFIDHTKQIKDKQPGKWYFSIYMLGLIVLFLFLYAWQGVSGAFYNDIFQWMGATVLSTMTGMLALYSLSAAFRAWHARTSEALVMILAGFLTVFGLIAPFGEVIWPGFGPLANYFNDYLFKAEQVVFYFATSLGSLLLGYRTLIGQETGYLRMEKGEK